jgi:hypothetical protein
MLIIPHTVVLTVIKHTSDNLSWNLFNKLKMCENDTIVHDLIG